jgi:SAM-dependent methyltransferase
VQLANIDRERGAGHVHDRIETKSTPDGAIQMLDSGTAAPEASAPPPAWPVLSLLACPLCHGTLAASERAALACGDCGTEWDETDGWLDFRPSAFRDSDRSWYRRQGAMEAWYDNLLTNSELAPGCYEHDYEPLARWLSELRGVVLDIGGGNGITRRYLHADAHYLDLDPSARWWSSEWLRVAGSLPGLLEPVTFVLGVGERLPLRAESVDVALSLFSLNHADEPERVLAEAGRVLRPGGTLFVVAEDIEPRWADFLSRGYRSGWHSVRGAMADKIGAWLGRREWPVAADHVPVTEAHLRAWLGGFDVERRSWLGGYLALCARKRG